MVLRHPRKLLKVLAGGYSFRDSTPDEKLAVKLWHNVALVALRKDWRAGKRLKKAFIEDKIYLGTMKSFSCSQLAWSMVLFKYWTKDTEIPVQEEEVGQRPPLGSALDTQNGQQEARALQKRKPIKVCVGNDQKHMLVEYRIIRKMLKSPATMAGEENEENQQESRLDVSDLVEGMESWDLYINGKDRAASSTARGHSGQEDVDNRDEFVPLPGVVLPGDSSSTGEDEDICEEDVLTQQQVYAA